VFPLVRLRLRALRTGLIDRTVRRLSRRHRLLAGVIAMFLARMAADRLLWRQTVREGESLVVTVRRRGRSVEPGAG